jgi:hypothetical protein
VTQHAFAMAVVLGMTLCSFAVARSQQHLFSLRVAGASGFFDDGRGEVALLYGRATRSTAQRHRAAAALGLAAVDGCITPGEEALFSQCEGRKTVAGLTLSPQLGKVR